MKSLVLVKCLQTKSVISTVKIPTLFRMQKVAAEVTLKEPGMTQLENYVGMLIP